MNTIATKTNKPPQAHKAQRRERKKLRNITTLYCSYAIAIAIAIAIAGE
jgi:hypothetical protein